MRLNQHLAAIIILLAVLVMSACQVPTPAPPTPTPGPRLATSTEDIVGMWSFSGYGLQFTQDGTYYLGAVSRLQDEQPSPDAEGEFWFEESQLHVREVAAYDMSPCGSETAVCEVRILENENLALTAVEDDCLARRRWWGESRGLKPVR